MRTPIKSNNTSQFERTIPSENTSPLFGIFEGKRRARIEQEKADRFLIEEEARRQTFILKQKADSAGYNPEKAEAVQNIQLEQTKQAADKTLYMILGFVVVAVMAGLYFIKKR